MAARLQPTRGARRIPVLLHLNASFLLAIAGLACSPAIAGPRSGVSADPPPCPPASELGLASIRAIRRSEPAYTQGLLFHDGRLIESVGGQGGRSRIQSIDLRTGRARVLWRTPGGDFGEGIAVRANELFQLTWTERRAHVYPLGKRDAPRTLPYPREGWGLAFDGARFYATDGTSRVFVAAEPGESGRILEIREEGRAIDRLNELEFADGRLYANRFQAERLYEIDPGSGCVTGVLDLGPLLRRFSKTEKARLSGDPNSVANGIAYDPGKKDFYLTGKNWPRIFVVRLRSTAR